MELETPHRTKHHNKDLLTCEKCGKQYERLSHFKSHTCVSTKNLKQKEKKKNVHL